MKTPASVSAVVVGHPPVGARRVEVHVRAEIGDEQRFAKQPGAEVRNDERHAGMVGGQRVKIEGIAVAHVEAARQVRAFSGRRRTARRSARTPRCRDVLRRQLDDLLHARVVQRIPLHRGKQADAPQAELVERALGPRRRIRSGRVEHEEADEARRMPRDRRRHRRFVARDAGDERRARRRPAIELAAPSDRRARLANPAGPIRGSRRSRPRIAAIRAGAGGRASAKNCSEKK